MTTPRITLDQWAALVQVVDSGSYAKAAAQLHKSQSTLTYAVGQVERLSGVKAFQVQGRRAVLTANGQVLYRRGKRLLDEAARLEAAAADLAAGWEPELRLAVEILFPTWLLLECLAKFAEERPHTRIELYESVLGGTSEALLEGRVDLAIAPAIPPGFMGEHLMQLRVVMAAHPDHPLHRLGRPVTLEDLKGHRHLVVRETDTRRAHDVGIETEERWTVSTKATSIRAACMGLGFSWYAEDTIREELASGRLKVLPLRDGAEHYSALHLVHADADAAGPGARRLAAIIRTTVRERCPREAPTRAPQ